MNCEKCKIEMQNRFVRGAQRRSKKENLYDEGLRVV